MGLRSVSHVTWPECYLAGREGEAVKSEIVADGASSRHPVIDIDGDQRLERFPVVDKSTDGNLFRSFFQDDVSPPHHGLDIGSIEKKIQHSFE